MASSRHNPGPYHGRLHLLSKATRYSRHRLPRPEGFPSLPANSPPPWAQYARRQSGSSRTASSRFLGQRFPTNQSVSYRAAIGWRRQGQVWTFRLRFKNLARKAIPWSAPPLEQRGQTRARNHGVPAPPPRSPPPLCAGSRLLPPRPPAEREAGNGRRCLPDPSPGASLARRCAPLRPADLSVHLTLGADGG